LARADNLLDLNRPDQARELAAGVLADDPGSGPALGVLSRAHQALNQHKEALVAARACVAAAPEDPHHHLVLVDAYRGAQEFSAAVLAAQEAVRLAPYSWTGHYALALALLDGARPRTRDAYEVALHTLSLAPNSPAVHNLLGMCLADLQQPEHARRAYEQALALDPHNANALNNLALLDLERGHFRRAAAGLRSAVRLDPQHQGFQANFEVMVMRLCGRALIGLAAVLLLVAVQLDAGSPWPLRMSTGVIAAAIVGVLAHRFLSHFPSGLSKWSLVRPAALGWRARSASGVLLVMVALVLFLAVAPRQGAVSVGVVLLKLLPYVARIGIFMLIGAALRALLTGK
jgi:tetratricopeptide (TPR) repeat protein